MQEISPQLQLDALRLLIALHREEKQSALDTSSQLSHREALRLRLRSSLYEADDAEAAVAFILDRSRARLEGITLGADAGVKDQKKSRNSRRENSVTVQTENERNELLDKKSKDKKSKGDKKSKKDKERKHKEKKHKKDKKEKKRKTRKEGEGTQSDGDDYYGDDDAAREDVEGGEEITFTFDDDNPAE